MTKAYLVYNPAAGRYPSRLLTERAARLLESYGWDIRLERTQDGEHITRLARQAVEEGMDAFLVAGGDGSLNQAVAGLVGSSTALGVLPAGTANVWAQELGLPGLTWTRWGALEESARRLADARSRPIDVGLCNGRAFLLWAGVGLDGFIVHRIEPRQPWAKHFSVVHYTASAIWNASMWRGMNLRVEVDGSSIEGHFLLAVLSNIRLYAGGYVNLFPQARLDDGKLDLWLFKGETLGDTVQFAWELLSGNHLVSQQAERVSFESLRLASNSPMYMQVDGEPIPVENGVHVRVLPKALHVLVPRDLPHPLFESD